MANKRKIAYAHHLPGWKFEGGNREVLKASRRVTPDEYEEDMRGALSCPGCFTNVERTPKEKDLFTNQRDPFYRHLKRWSHVACVLRAKKPIGKRYDTWEEAKRAVEHEHLAVVKEFLQEKPEIDLVPGDEYDETPVEDVNGPLSEVPIGRHHGESFELPSKITTVAGICRNFEKNKDKYFVLPGAIHAVKLAELLTDVADLERKILDETQKPRLFFGKILRSWNAGKYSTSIRMTRLRCGRGVGDFTVKMPDGFCQAKNINDASVGRIVMFYGVITKNGGSIGVEHLAWGEIALVPKKYNELLIPE
ncbi:hypothetical protein [Pseudomonas frederiksbergensis]|uniref:PARP-type domain-containing protein n=1 Tax=Pseudomonas frederiksbergensis TaxID=104087 RepID=A0A6L5BPY9_9PSED|nr:hypothetical protein [Pseudomonas frederiksbergensis]KAF2390791.1 hypothetical protein FX983_05258 [Pseudomonas frederiksbergensis]